MKIFWQIQDEVDGRDFENPELVDRFHTYIFTDYEELMPNDEVLIVEYSERYAVYTQFWIISYKKWQSRTNNDLKEFSEKFDYSKFFDDVFSGSAVENN